MLAAHRSRALQDASDFEVQKKSLQRQAASGSQVHAVCSVQCAVRTGAWIRLGRGYDSALAKHHMSRQSTEPHSRPHALRTAL